MEFKSADEFDLKFESLDIRRGGIELCNFKGAGSCKSPTVFVPEGKLDLLVNKIRDYSDPSKDTPKGNPRNQELVESIEAVKEAAIHALWTDDRSLFPTDNSNPMWWEVWLRGPRSDIDRGAGSYACHAAVLHQAKSRPAGIGYQIQVSVPWTAIPGETLI